MEEIDEHLLITGIEVSGWKDQLKTSSKSISYNKHLSCNSIDFFLIIPTNHMCDFITILHLFL